MPETKVEIVVLGTGGGYGESIVVRLGKNCWVVIDSCVNPINQSVLPLDYLKSRNVSLSTDVKLIICTHWHNDHILGLDKLYSECDGAEFCFAPAHDTKKFLLLLSLDYSKHGSNSSNSSTDIFNKCIEILRERQKSVKRAVQDKMLIRHGNSEIYALSPSDRTLQYFDEELSGLITDFGSPNKRIVTRSPNAKSVALYLKIGEHRAILGGDLEVSSNEDEGWINIIANCTKTVIDKPASMFKVPHHGSENGYHIEIWNTLLVNSPVATLTPWNRSKKLPTSQMVQTMRSHTDRLFITSNTQGRRAKKRDRSIEKFVARLNPTLREIKYSYGLIHCMIDPDDFESEWDVSTHGTACQLI